MAGTVTATGPLAARPVITGVTAIALVTTVTAVGVVPVMPTVRMRAVAGMPTGTLVREARLQLARRLRRVEATRHLRRVAVVAVAVTAVGVVVVGVVVVRTTV